jgi:hypothetical protein
MTQEILTKLGSAPFSPKPQVARGARLRLDHVPKVTSFPRVYPRLFMLDYLRPPRGHDATAAQGPAYVPSSGACTQL